MMDEKIIEAMKATIVEAFNKSGPSFSVRMTSGITAPQVNHIECTFDLEAVTRAAWTAAQAALAEAGMVCVPREPTSEMQAAAYYAGSVGDNGSAERTSFADEWKAAIDQHQTGKEPTGLLRLVRPW